MTEHYAPRGGATGPQRPARSRLAALGQVLGDRRRANDRLWRSLWISLFAHTLLFLGLAPFALPRQALQAAVQPEPVEVLRISEAPELVQLTPEQLERSFPEPESTVDEQRPRQVEPPDPALERDRQERALAEQQELEAPPERKRQPQRLEFVRSHHQASEQAPDTQRISTQNQIADQERVALARAQVANGRAERGTQAGTPRDAARHGAQPQQPTSGAPTALEQRQDEPQQATARATAPQARTHREDQQPCGQGQSVAGGPCDALADARQARDSQQLRGSTAHDRREQSPPHTRAREGWEPLAVRVTGLADQARPFAEAPLPDRATSPSATTAHDAVLVARPSPNSTKPAQDDSAQRKETARAVQQSRARGSSQPEPSPDRERPAAELEPPQPELQFLVEPLELMRQEQEQEQQQASARQQNQRQRRRSAPPGSARASASSAPGSEAAAGGSVVSPIDPPPAIDVRTVLSTRAHPLSGVLQALDDELREAWEIPFDVRVSGVVGTTGVELLLDRRGRVRDVVTTRPSGHALLDQAARQAIPPRIADFSMLLEGEARDTFPSEGLRVYYEFEYTDSPVAGVL
jgi:outer membrane biosynthesis protein TonB